MKTIEITIRGYEATSAHDAIVELNFSGDLAISICGRFFTVTDAEYRRIQDLGIQPTTWHHHEPTGRILSVPGDY
jgi:hypothetical protein